MSKKVKKLNLDKISDPPVPNRAHTELKADQEAKQETKNEAKNQKK